MTNKPMLSVACTFCGCRNDIPAASWGCVTRVEGQCFVCKRPIVWAADDKPAAQHQGEPVAYWYVGDIGGYGCLHTAPDKDGIKLYAEHTAPVAVVMPERKPDPGMVAGMMSKWAQGWNEALDDVARLNGVKP